MEEESIGTIKMNKIIKGTDKVLKQKNHVILYVIFVLWYIASFFVDRFQCECLNCFVNGDVLQYVCTITIFIMTCITLFFSLLETTHHGIQISDYRNCDIYRHERFWVIIAVTAVLLLTALVQLQLKNRLGYIVISAELIGYCFYNIILEFPIMERYDGRIIKIEKRIAHSEFENEREAVIKSSLLDYYIRKLPLQEVYRILKDDKTDYDEKLLNVLIDAEYQRIEEQISGTMTIKEKELVVMDIRFLLDGCGNIDNVSSAPYKNYIISLFNLLLSTSNGIIIAKRLMHSMLFRLCVDKKYLVYKNIIIEMALNNLNNSKTDILVMIRQYFSDKDYFLSDSKYCSEVILMISMYLFYLIEDEKRVPASEKEKFKNFILDNPGVVDSTLIIPWYKLHAIATSNRDTNPLDYLELYKQNEYQLDYTLFESNMHTVIIDSYYVFRWYMICYISECNNAIHKLDKMHFVDANIRNLADQFFNEFLVESKYHDNGIVHSYCEMYKINEKHFTLFFEIKFNEIDDIITQIKAEALEEKIEKGNQISGDVFANEMQVRLTDLLSKEYGFVEGDLEICEELKLQITLKSGLDDNIESYARLFWPEICKMFKRKKRVLSVDEFLAKYKDSSRNVVAMGNFVKYKIRGGSNLFADSFVVEDTKVYDSSILGSETILFGEDYKFNASVSCELKHCSADELWNSVEQYRLDDGRYLWEGVYFEKNELYQKMDVLYKKFIIHVRYKEISQNAILVKV